MSTYQKLWAVGIAGTATTVAFFLLSSPPTILLLSQLVDQGGLTISQLVSAGITALFSSPFSELPTVLVPIILASLIIGINAMLAYFLWMRSRLFPRNPEGIVGFFATLFGVGCATCGSVITASLLANFGGISLITALPLGGQEIGYFGIGLLLISTLSLSRQLRKPLVCS